MIELTLDKQTTFSEQGSKNTGAQSGGTIQTCASHNIVWTKVTPLTGRTLISSDLPTPKGHVKQSNPTFGRA